MKKQTITELITAKMIALTHKYNGNLADIRLTAASYDASDDVLCHLSSTEGGVDVYGSLRFLHRLMEIKGWKNERKGDRNARFWIQPVKLEEDEAEAVRLSR